MPLWKRLLRLCCLLSGAGSPRDKVERKELSRPILARDCENDMFVIRRKIPMPPKQMQLKPQCMHPRAVLSNCIDYVEFP